MIAHVRSIHTKTPVILSTEKKNSKQSKAVTTKSVKIKKTQVADCTVLHSSNLAITSKNSERQDEKRTFIKYCPIHYIH